ncbi:MAG: protein phosphatase 2C domain-containing protein [Cyanobacteria bacterium P01_F01_bin.53]
MINCPNPSCKTANPEGAEVCQVCQSALPHFYLWGVGDLVANIRPGQLLNQRYLLKRDRTFLDTKPGLVPDSLPELPDFLLPYLHLSAYPLHTPRPYAVMRTPDDDYVLMLESSALSTATPTGGSPGDAPRLLPMLTKRWSEAPPLRQLNWLWQVAQVWDAFVAENVAATLLDESLLRVDGSIVRLLALASEPMPSPATAPVDRTQVPAQPTLMDLGRFWQPLAESAHQAVRAFLERLCEHLERQQLTAEQLTERLSQAIEVCGQGQVVNYKLAVNTDQGPTRKRNEDACYPASGASQPLKSDQTRSVPELLIVCDGIGGHQGGDVASKLAISTIEARLKPLLAADRPALNATELSLAIEAAICAANDEISAQNDQAQRQARDRMGTTLVMALVKGADIFIAHLGDSRAYRIGQRNCQQVTLDDDVASRQVRLGGGLYREVLPQPGSGSLIQALGMGPSQSLRPTVQRFVMDENCVFLLCSDGLSDSDRVEQFWQSELRPLVVSEGSADAVSKRLVDVANKYNGHDNVTVGVLSAQVVRPSDRIVPRELSAESAGVGAAATAQAGSGDAAKAQRNQTRLMAPIEPQVNSQAASGSPAPTSNVIRASQAQRSGKGFPKAGVGLLVLSALGGLLYFLFPGLSWRFASSPDAGTTSVASTPEADAPTATPAGEGASAVASSGGSVLSVADLTVGAYVRIRQSDIPGIRTSPEPKPGSKPAAGTGAAPGSNSGSTAGTNAATPPSPTSPTGSNSFSQLRLYPNPEEGVKADPNVITGTIPTGGIAQVIGKQVTTDKSEWLQLKLCSIPSGTTLDDIPAETDTPQAGAAPASEPTATGGAAGGSALNVPETTDTDRPLVLSPGNEGWIVAAKIAAVSELIQDLEPTQSGACGS